MLRSVGSPGLGGRRGALSGGGAVLRSTRSEVVMCCSGWGTGAAPGKVEPTEPAQKIPH